MQPKTLKFLGVALLVGGVAVIGVGVAGNLGSWGAKTETATKSGGGTSPAPTNASSTSTTVVPAEDATQFLAALGTALRAGDTNFLVGRLNPAVVARYGSAQCLGALAGARDPSATFTVKQVSDPADFDWTTDGKTVVIPDTLTVDVDRVVRGVAESATVHIARVNGQLTWLVDCGIPTGP